jgi:hypothetical protein
VTLEVGLHAFLLADPAVAALIGTRMTPLVLPQNTAYPALTYQRISGQRLRSVDGPAGRARPRMQIDSWAETYLEAKALAAAVRRALDGYAGPMGAAQVGAVSLDDERDIHEDEPKVSRVTQDYLISHEET